jgi:ribokinase
VGSVKVAVVGHVEWVEFLKVDHVPLPGEIVHADGSWEEPGGGGAVAAAQLLKLAGEASFFTALGDDALGRRAQAELERLGLRVHAAARSQPTRRAVTHVDRDGERTITVIGDRLGPSGGDPLPWDELADADAVYFTAGDEAALRAARRAGVLVATSRTLAVLARGGVRLDALLGSANDSSETFARDDVAPAPSLCVWTDGERGGTYETDGGRGRYAPAALPGPVADRYGAGDSFAAGLTFALGQGRSAQDAIGFAARCGAAALTGAGPYAAQLSRHQL